MSKFEEDLTKLKLEEQPEDKYGGVRYQVRMKDNAGRIRLPAMFYRMSKLRTDEMYAYIHPEQGDEEFEKVRSAMDRLVKAIESKLGSKIKDMTPPIKTDKSDGMIVKPYFRYDNGERKITSKFFDSDSKLIIPEKDERLTSERYTKTVYPILDVDSVYISSDGKASIQIKIAECVLYAKEVQSVLDLDLINKMRAMKLKGETKVAAKRF